MALSTFIHTYIHTYVHTYIHGYETTLTEQDHQALSHLTLYFKWVKNTTTNKNKPSASLKASDHTLLHTEYTITQTLYLLVPEELYEKNPTDKYKFL